jgi:transposase
VLDRLNRHDLTDEEWERLRVFLPPIRRGAAGGPITGW